MKYPLKKLYFETKLGQMIAVADEEAVYLLEFADCKKLDREVSIIQKKMKTPIVSGETPAIHSIRKELDLYFEEKLKQFNTKLSVMGSPFQETVWNVLMAIPYGETRSYADVAKTVGNPVAYRAVAKGNSTNHIVIAIPCHRVINSSGELGGYSSGLSRKKQLLTIEGLSL